MPRIQDVRIETAESLTAELLTGVKDQAGKLGERPCRHWVAATTARHSLACEVWGVGLATGVGAVATACRRPS